MNIFFRTKNVDISQDAKDSFARRIEGLEKFFALHAQAYIDIEKDRNQNSGDDIYHTSIRINEAHNSYFSEEYRESVLASFDYAYQDIFRIIRNDRSKSRKLSRRLGARVKRMFKKI